MEAMQKMVSFSSKRYLLVLAAWTVALVGAADNSKGGQSSLPGYMDPDKFWSGGVVPYEISHTFRKNEIRQIKMALENISNQTKGCVSFRNRATEPDYIYFAKAIVGCTSFLGRVGGKQRLALQSACIVQLGGIQRQIMHALGFNDEHRRPDRDNFITILTDNIQPSMIHFFDVLPGMNTYNTPYDYESVTHYPLNAFARESSLPTIAPKAGGAGKKIGQREGISATDAIKIQKAYKCL